MSNLVNLASLKLDTVLSLYAQGLINDPGKFVWPQVCPTLLAFDEKGKVLMMDPEYSLRLKDWDKAYATENDNPPLLVDYKMGSKDYTMYYLKLGTHISEQQIKTYERQKAGKISIKTPVTDPGSFGAKFIVNQFQSMLEKKFFADVLTSGNYKSGHSITVAAADRWDVNTNNPNDDLQTARDLMALSGGTADTMITSPYAWDRIIRNPFLKTDLMGERGGIVSMERFQQVYLGQKGRVLLSEGLYWDGMEGAASPTGTTRMLKDDIILAKVGDLGQAKNLLPGIVPKTFYTVLYDPDYWFKMYRVPDRFSEKGYTIVCMVSFGLVYGADTVSNNKIDSGVLINNVVS